MCVCVCVCVYIWYVKSAFWFIFMVSQSSMEYINLIFSIKESCFFLFSAFKMEHFKYMEVYFFQRSLKKEGFQVGYMHFTPIDSLHMQVLIVRWSPIIGCAHELFYLCIIYIYIYIFF